MISNFTDDCGCGCERPAMSGFAAQLFDQAVQLAQAEAWRASRILDYAFFCGFQDDGAGGTLELWTLRKALGKAHPEGSTVTRATLERYLFGKSYGITAMPAEKPKDFQAIE